MDFIKDSSMIAVGAGAREMVALHIVKAIS